MSGLAGLDLLLSGSAVSGFPGEEAGCPGARDGPDVRMSSDFRKYRSVAMAPVVRSVSVVRALGLVGRPAFVGRLAAVAFVGWTSGLAGAPGVGRPVSAGCPVAIDSWQLLL